ncbi:MAG: hypothetical protein WD751_05285 [Anaerolineales bacterium]
MNKTWAAYLLFWLGVFLLGIHTTLPVLWTLLGLPEPIPFTADSGVLYYLQGFTPPLGAILMLIAGLVYGAQSKRGEK